MDNYRKELDQLKPFLPRMEYEALRMDLIGEEKDGIGQMIKEWNSKIATMPKTYDQDGAGDNAVVHLHYFLGPHDWYITEKDMYDEQNQAFGWACLNGDTQNAELGYISIPEITACGVLLDLHWTPRPLREVKAMFGL